MRNPGLHEDELEGGDASLPRATIPPVTVTLGEEMTLAGSDNPEIITAWMFEDVFAREPPGGTGVPGGEVDRLFDP